MLHLATALSTSSRQDIEDRLTGKFYTPQIIAERLAASSVAVGCPESVCDPFCGDGRLVVSWLRQHSSRETIRRLKKISLWDYDAAAVLKASASVQAELSQLRADWVVVDTHIGDTFTRDNSETFELVITNPPWEQLKPDSRDGVNDTSLYRTQIQDYARTLAARFPDSATSRKRSIGGYTINLARAGAILSAELTANSGSLLIVLPSTIFGDQVSGGFRNYFFSKMFVSQIDFYPAEAKLFQGVDQSFVTVASRRGLQSSTVKIRRFRPDLSVDDLRDYRLVRLEEPLPISIGEAEYELIQQLRNRHPEAKWLEDDLRFGLWLGRELDETRIAESFTSDEDGVPFVKGRDIRRFGTVSTDLPKIDPSLRRIPVSAFESRVAWRDVSRPSQKRRVHACIVPPGMVTGNSLGVARFKSPLPHLLETLVAVMNSIVFEVQVRGRLATNHVSQGVIRHCTIPHEIFESARIREGLAELVTEYSDARPQLLTRMEVSIARLYGINRDDFAQLLRPFTKLSAQERESLLNKENWS
jgi:Alw26I/Eco31I/Esp3I family type II restriction m6 adenine DNA methyltransferase